MQRFNFKSIGKSIFLRIGVVFTIGLFFLLLSLFVYLFYEINNNKNLTKKITASLSSSNVLDKIDRNFYERFGDVQAFAYNQLAKETLDSGRSTQKIQQFINTMTTYYVLYDLMMVCDLKGNAVVTNTVDKKGTKLQSAFMIGKNFSEEEWFKSCIGKPGPEGGAWYSKFMANNDVAKIYKTPGYGMGFAAPIKNESGDVIGVWFNFASWAEITQSIRTEAEQDLDKTNPGSIILLTRSNGEIIDATDFSLISKQSVLTQELTNVQDYSNFNVAGQTIDFAEYIAEWATAKGAYTYKGRNWRAVTMIPKANVNIAAIFSGKLVTVYSTILLIVLSCGFFFYKYFNKRVVQKINLIQHRLDKIAVGEVVAVAADLKTEDEIGQIAAAMDKVATNIHKTSVFAEEIGKGNLDMLHELRSDKDVLGVALLTMQKNLKNVRDEEEHRIWATEGLAKFGEIVRKLSDDSIHMADNLVSELVRYLGANQCMLYTVATRDDGATKFLKLEACYAYDRKKYIQKEIEIGEGMTGQAYLEQEAHFMTQVPQNYMQIGSGFGAADPSCIFIVPLLYEGEVMGVLEIASFKIFPEYQRHFMEKVALVISSALRNFFINNRTSKLLRDSQVMTEQLRTQEEEMRQNMEELTATQEESERKQDQSEKQQALYKTILDAIPLPLFVQDEAGKLLVENKAQIASDRIKSHNSNYTDDDSTEIGIDSGNQSIHSGNNGKLQNTLKRPKSIGSQLTKISFKNPVSGEINVLCLALPEEH